jgi:hypothetical protein
VSALWGDFLSTAGQPPQQAGHGAGGATDHSTARVCEPTSAQPIGGGIAAKEAAQSRRPSQRPVAPASGAVAHGKSAAASATINIMPRSQCIGRSASLNKSRKDKNAIRCVWESVCDICLLLTHVYLNVCVTISDPVFVKFNGRSLSQILHVHKPLSKVPSRIAARPQQPF